MWWNEIRRCDNGCESLGFRFFDLPAFRELCGLFIQWTTFRDKTISQKLKPFCRHILFIFCDFVVYFVCGSIDKIVVHISNEQFFFRSFFAVLLRRLVSNMNNCRMDFFLAHSTGFDRIKIEIQTIFTITSDEIRRRIYANGSHLIENQIVFHFRNFRIRLLVALVTFHSIVFYSPSISHFVVIFAHLHVLSFWQWCVNVFDSGNIFPPILCVPMRFSTKKKKKLFPCVLAETRGGLN